MELQQALHIISYKTALKKGIEAQNDPILLPESINKALIDQKNNTPETIPAKDYMAATKIIREHRNQLFKKQNEDFLTKNKTLPQIQTTPSGLQYKILTKGTGSHPSPESQVTVHYHGTLIDDTTFDTTEGKEPKAFELKKVISGWREGVLLMKPGATHTLYIPQNLAYGERDLPKDIPPYATLIIKVELINSV